mgnify:CR=1 FL=1
MTVTSIDFKNQYIDIPELNIQTDSTNENYLDIVQYKITYLNETTNEYNKFKTLVNNYVPKETEVNGKYIYNFRNEVENKRINDEIKKLIIKQNTRLYNFKKSIENIRNS